MTSRPLPPVPPLATASRYLTVMLAGLMLYSSPPVRELKRPSMPERTPSGYRKFSPQDVQRLRFVLAQQRDNYLPLRVIKEHLDAIDRGL